MLFLFILSSTPQIEIATNYHLINRTNSPRARTSNPTRPDSCHLIDNDDDDEIHWDGYHVGLLLSVDGTRSMLQFRNFLYVTVFVVDSHSLARFRMMMIVISYHCAHKSSIHLSIPRPAGLEVHPQSE